ncbi:hypothetical protein ACFPN2_19780 [Steroidobacter flavus]|uniref:Uncharacterized protein n=1 Tax=Steroidobacter flavus TaxID=1842136 RepID=A0ABV8SYC5_9GAMM
MNGTDHVSIDETLRHALAQGMAATELWSLLLSVLEQRAAQRTPSMVRQQWKTDRFVQPCAVNQRMLNELDSHLLAAAAEFEALELSPVAPLASCSTVALTSQNRIVSTARGTEVVSDPTNVLALECARRLREAPDAVIKLTTSHRCVRAQAVPKRPGFSAHFRMFCLASAAHERKDHGFVTEALAEHIRTHLSALDRLEKHGYHFPDRRLRLLATPERRHLAERMSKEIVELPVTLETLEHPYYDGLRFMIDAGTPDGNAVPLIDGGAFDWLRKLTDNKRMVYVASGMGSQLAAMLFRRVARIA